MKTASSGGGFSFVLGVTQIKLCGRMESVIRMCYTIKKEPPRYVGEKMETTANLFLTILKAALQGQRIEPDREILADEWEKLFKMAGIHNVLPMFFEAVYASKSMQQSNLSFLPAVKRQVRQQVMMQALRTGEFLALNQSLQAAGIRPLVVKGIICRNLYPQPDYRQSGDEDVLIPEEQYAACHQVLLDFGMHTTTEETQRATSYEVPYRKAGSSLYIELHKQLFPPESDAYGDMNRFFAGVFRRAIPETIQGNIVYTLAPGDHLFYLICHAFKHFLHSGFGIRQVCDIVLYANAYGREVDWMDVLDRCRELNADKFAAALFRIGSNYLVFDMEKAGYPDAWRQIRVDETPMLADLLSAGVYGGADMSRKHSSSITLDAVAAQKRGRKARHAALTSAFPPASQLSGRYPYLKKAPWLLPAAWASRLLHYFKETRGSDNNNAAEALKIGSERIELMKEYGILK